MKRESFIFYKSFYDSIKELDPEDQVQIYDAIFQYEFEGIEKELKGVCKSIFTLIIPQLEANNKRYENGKKGGRPKNQTETKTKPKDNQTETKTKANVNENENVNVNDNVNKKENIKRKNFVKPTLEEVTNYCNERNNNVDPDRFINFYESKGWKVGNQPMKDWKACVRTWERGSKEEKLPEWFNKDIKKQKNEKEDELKDMLKEFE